MIIIIVISFWYGCYLGLSNGVQEKHVRNVLLLLGWMKYLAVQAYNGTVGREGLSCLLLVECVHTFWWTLKALAQVCWEKNEHCSKSEVIEEWSLPEWKHVCLAALKVCFLLFTFLLPLLTDGFPGLCSWTCFHSHHKQHWQLDHFLISFVPLVNPHLRKLRNSPLFYYYWSCPLLLFVATLSLFFGVCVATEKHIPYILCVVWVSASGKSPGKKSEECVWGSVNSLSLVKLWWFAASLLPQTCCTVSFISHSYGSRNFSTRHSKWNHMAVKIFTMWQANFLHMSRMPDQCAWDSFFFLLSEVKSVALGSASTIWDFPCLCCPTVCMITWVEGCWLVVSVCVLVTYALIASYSLRSQVSHMC